MPKKQKSVANRRGEDSEEATEVPKDKSVVAKKASTGSTSSASASSMSSPPPAYPSAEMREKSPENERVTSDKSELDDKVKVTDFRCVMRFFQDGMAKHSNMYPFPDLVLIYSASSVTNPSLFQG